VLRPGAVVGRFELVRELGRGGFGVVWEARDRELGRAVAFKAVRAGGDPGLREERLLREAEAAARLSHPNIVTLLDVGRSEHGPYLVLELLRGTTLAGRLAHGPLSVKEAVRVAEGMARGVAHAHAAGVVHRDLKPENVFLCEDGIVKVLDLGMAHAFGQRRAAGGTSGYMAPEQAEGAPEDERTDVWAMGVILREMLAGRDEVRRPGTGSGPALEVDDAPTLAALVRRMTATRPVDRPRDAGEVLGALGAVRGELERDGHAGEGRARVIRWRRLRRAGGLAIAAALGAATVLGVQAWRHHSAGAPAPPTSSPVALQHFVEGMIHLESSRHEEALAAFERATAADPDFALSHLWIALLGPLGGFGAEADLPAVANAEKRNAALAAARRSQDRLPDRERAILQAFDATVAGRAEAPALHEHALRAFPDDKLVLLHAAARPGATRPPLDSTRASCEDSTLLERAVAADPFWQPSNARLTYCLHSSGRGEEELSRARAWVERAPSAAAYRALTLALVNPERAEEAIAAGRRALALDDGTTSRFGLWLALSQADRFEEAEEVLRPVVEPRRSRRERVVGGVALAGALAHQGRFREAHEALDLYVKDPRGARGLEDWFHLLLAWCGDDSPEALRLSRSILQAPNLQRQFAPAGLLLHGDAASAAEAARTVAPGAGLRQYEGLLAWKNGDVDRALAILRDTGTANEPQFRYGAEWTRALVAFSSGRDDEVLDAARRMSLLARGGAFQGACDARATYWTATIQARRGERSRSKETLDRFLARWHRADPDLPVLADVKKLRAGL
jgi:serine/threonine protein kinase/tetratricopeptide (TPR) repeat protein